MRDTACNRPCVRALTKLPSRSASSMLSLKQQHQEKGIPALSMAALTNGKMMQTRTMHGIPIKLFLLLL